MFVAATYNPLSVLNNSAFDFDVDVAEGRSTVTGDSNSVSTRSRYAVSQVNRTDGGYNLSIDLPGISRNNVSVKVEGNLLMVAGKRSLRDDSTINYISNWTISDSINVNGITANYESGILELFVPILPPKVLTIKID